MVCARIANTARSSGWIPVQTPFGRFQVESWPVTLDRGPRVPYYLVMLVALTTPTALATSTRISFTEAGDLIDAIYESYGVATNGANLEAANIEVDRALACAGWTNDAYQAELSRVGRSA